MTQELMVRIQVPEELEFFQFPESLNRRLHDLLDKQDAGEILTPEERSEAEGLVEVAQMISVLRGRTEVARRELEARTRDAA